jgi:SAM-dependent methyltransferase
MEKKYMDKSLLIKIFGFPAMLIHGDTLVLDRWKWLKVRLPITKNGEKVIDVGCGSGAFSIGAARRGYETLGVDWNEQGRTVAEERAKICKTQSAKFEVLDVRNLDTRGDLVGKFDIAICLENIEHIIDDRKLFQDISSCLEPGGYLLLSTPYLHYRPLSSEDSGPFPKIEDGGHVRRGYSKAMLEELCKHSGLVPEEISFCSGYLSQKITTVLRVLARIHPLLGWAFILPLRAIPPVFDKLVTNLVRCPYYSICLKAYKPRFPESV